MQIEPLLFLWGKTDRHNPSSFHPLLFHLLDVANVARIMWNECLPPAVHRRLAQGLNLTEREAGGMIPFLAGLHDIGKASPSFQSKSDEGRQRLRSIGFRFPNAKSDVLHGEISAFVVDKLLSDGTVARYDRQATETMARIIGGHHGIFPDPSRKTGADIHVGDPMWESTRRELAQILFTLLEVELPESLPAISDSGVIPLLAGFTSVADWLGSSERHFPPSSGMEIGEYLPLSRARAEQVLLSTGWLPRARHPAEEQAFGEIFRFPFGPKPMQKAVADIADRASNPYLLIVEEQMGGGKTEAALFCADRTRCRRQSGFYVALPTQATSDAMYARVRDDYLLGEPLHLVHGNARLMDDDRLLEQAPEKGRGVESLADVESWFTARKRPLLASFGVGTIDQSLMAVLQTKHWFVRLFGLAGKTVIFDEVHAYDLYMTDILKRLIRWLAELECTVVILSATLPNQRRRELVRAYSDDEDLEWEEYEYPRLTVYEGYQARSIKLPPAESRTIHLSRKGDDPANVPGIVRESLPDGGCGVVICNTVSKAQEAFRVLREEMSDWDVYLFHARFTTARRRKIEEKVLPMFGKDEPHRPPRAILIATQVVEQSLDLDFDWMASDFAPVDLLLQRVGRMWRHDRSHRPVEKPVLTLLCGGDADRPNFGKSKYVYDEYVLLRSWVSLHNKEAISIPDEIESLVESVYQDVSISLQSNLEERLEKARKEFERKKLEDETKAKNVLITYPRRPSIVLSRFNADLADDEDPNVHDSIRAATRLGRPSISLICLDERQGRIYPINGEPGESVDLASAPDTPTVRRLLESSVSVSNWPLVHALKTPTPENCPLAWRRNSHLRHARLAVFHNGVAEISETTVRLSDDIGLEILSGPQEEEE